MAYRFAGCQHRTPHMPTLRITLPGLISLSDNRYGSGVYKYRAFRITGRIDWEVASPARIACLNERVPGNRDIERTEELTSRIYVQ